MKYGTIELFPSAVIKNLKPESLTAEQEAALDLTNGKARIWFNEAEKKLKFYDGAATHTIAVGGSLKDYIRHDGTVAMTADLELSSTDQSGSKETVAVSKGFMQTKLDEKEDKLKGAASTIAQADLDADRVMISDASGKAAAATVTTTELGHLSGLTESVNDALAKKEDVLGYKPLDVAGSNEMTAALAMANHQITGVAKGTMADHAVNMAQLENAIAGLDFQKDIDGVQADATLVTEGTKGARYLILDPAALHESFGTIEGVEANDIVEHNGEKFVVAYDVSLMGEGALVWNMANNEYLRWDGASWDKFGGLSGVTAGVGLEKDGDVIRVVLGAGLIIGEDGNSVTVQNYNLGSIQLVDPVSGEASTAANAVMSIKLNGASLVSDVDGLKIAAQGVTAVELHADVAGNGLAGANGSALSVKKADESIVVDENGVKLNEAHTDTIYARQDGATFTAEIGVVDATADNHAMPKSQIESTIDERAGNKIDEFAARYEASYYTHNSADHGGPSLVHTVVHNVGTKGVQVVCYGTDDMMFIPNSVNTVDENTVEVTVSELIDCRIEVQGMKPAPVAAPEQPAEEPAV